MKNSESSIKGLILAYLKEKDSWIFGGTIEDYIRAKEGAKASNASRRCRELADEGLIERQIVSIEIEGKTRRVVQYRVKPTTPVKVEGQVVKVPSMF